MCELKMRLLLSETFPEELLSHLTQVMSDLCQEEANNDVTTGSQKSTEIVRPSGILCTNQIHKNVHVDNGLAIDLCSLASDPDKANRCISIKRCRLQTKMEAVLFTLWASLQFPNFIHLGGKSSLSVILSVIKAPHLLIRTWNLLLCFHLLALVCPGRRLHTVPHTLH